MLGFALFSIAEPSPSMADLPIFAEWGIYGLFIVATPMLMAGAFAGKLGLFVVGHILLIIGLLTVAGVVITTSESPVSVLIFGYGCAISYSLQKTLRERKLINEIAADTAPHRIPIDEDDR